MIKLCIVLLLLRFLQGTENRCAIATNPLKMIVLYESLCVDSQRFITSFWPVYQEYHQCINLTLVPHGKSTREKDGFKCQHGYKECWANRMHNCALHSHLNQFQKMRFVSCEMENLTLVRNQNLRCAKSLRIKRSVENCMKFQGGEYQTQAARITNQYRFSEVPAIIFNGVFNESMQSSTRENVRQTLCDILMTTKHLLPDGC